MFMCFCVCVLNNIVYIQYTDKDKDKDFLRLIQLEPLNLETSFKLWRVGLVKDTYAMYFSFF